MTKLQGVIKGQPPPFMGRRTLRGGGGGGDTWCEVEVEVVSRDTMHVLTSYSRLLIFCLISLHHSREKHTTGMP